jgi:hypothetical protein
MTTREKLAQAIREVATEPRHERLANRAEEGYYDDFLSPLATPIVQLVRDAMQMGLHGIAERAKAGEFDSTLEEAEAWRRSPEGQEVFRELMEGR